MKKKELFEELAKASGKLFEVSETLLALDGTAFVNDDPRDGENPPMDVRIVCYDWVERYFRICEFILGNCAEITNEIALRLDKISIEDITEDKEE